MGQFGDKSTSNVIVRLRTAEGRDDWFYCHSHNLIKNSKYFSDRLSDKWSTCRKLDSHNCVDVYCQEPEVNHYVNILRLFYDANNLRQIKLYGVRNVLGILLVAIHLECTDIVNLCVNYLEAVPWEETEEEEILRSIPSLGLEVQPILARLKPVDAEVMTKVFVSTIHFATSSPSTFLNELKCSAQEQLEYMITEDDDVPLLTFTDNIKFTVKKCISDLLTRFCDSLESFLSQPTDNLSNLRYFQDVHSMLFDIAWSCQILGKMEIMKDFVLRWVELSESIVLTMDRAILKYNILSDLNFAERTVTEIITKSQLLEIKSKAIEVTSKVLETIGYGNVILPTYKRLYVVKVWLPFVRKMKSWFETISINSDESKTFQIDDEIWQSIESSFVSIVLTLPSTSQAHILSDWLRNNHIRYPDLTEAFEVWCYRSKISKRRLVSLGILHCLSKSSNSS